MITKIKIHNIASYSKIVEFEPKRINYFFGSNGVGKSTLGRVISESSSYPDSELTWKNSPVEIYSYNKDFVHSGFSQNSEIKGIFTLGKDSTDAQKLISETNEKIHQLTELIDKYQANIDNQKKNLFEKKGELKEKAWLLKKKYDSTFREAFIGFMGSAEAFTDKCILEQGNTSQLLTEDALKEKMDRIFSADLLQYELFPIPSIQEFIALESSIILETPIIGKEDIEIGQLIQRLGNSDWIKEGVNYLNKTDNQCPFCQQSIAPELKTTIESFFDETYEKHIQELNSYASKYTEEVNKIIKQLEAIVSFNIPILNFIELNEKIKLLSENFKINTAKLATKQKSPSIKVSLQIMEPLFDDILTIIARFNKTINENNSTLANLRSEKDAAKKEVWRFIIKELSSELNSYKTAELNTNKALQGLGKALDKGLNEKKKLSNIVRDKESEITSVKPTVTEINRILKLFGFTSFSLAEAEKIGFYKIIREDGTDAKESLSEGESTFLTYLYFYHMLRGSLSDTGIGKNKVVLIDDPISSLDSNVLFIVSNLTKELINSVKHHTYGIKQIFILSHNVYFFKEVTFRGNRVEKMPEEAYWIIRKLDNTSSLKEHDKNPIKTTYELLWRELDDISSINTATIFNTLRRILEYYFNILGGLNYEQAISEFEGEEQIICKTLISWTNDGSHFINDDIVVDAEPENIQKYLDVFKLIFAKMGHISHYNMMMPNNI